MSQLRKDTLRCRQCISSLLKNLSTLLLFTYNNSFKYVFSHIVNMESIDVRRISVQICAGVYVVMMHTILLHFIPPVF